LVGVKNLAKLDNGFNKVWLLISIIAEQWIFRCENFPSLPKITVHTGMCNVSKKYLHIGPSNIQPVFANGWKTIQQIICQ
jgi:hypothetical protein